MSLNIDLTDILPELDLYDRSWPIWTHAEITPPAKFIHDEEGRRGSAITSLVSGGCIISGAALRRSLLFTGVHLHSWSRVENAVILPYVDVGEGARLTNVVIDRRCCEFRRDWWSAKIPKATPQEEDFRTTERGINLITQAMIDGLAT